LEAPVGIMPVSNALPLIVFEGPVPDVAVCGVVSSFLHTIVLPLTIVVVKGSFNER
jgi:hypothetical protein